MASGLIDSHAHLQEPGLFEHLDAALQRARDAGVTHIICNGTREEDWATVGRMARAHGEVVPCFGLHPWKVPQRSPRWREALEEALDSMPSAVGEVGLDRYVEPRDEPAQEEVFRAQLEMARQRRRPVMVHCLRAWGWLMEVLESEADLPGGMLIHAYGGAPDLIGKLAQRGAYFSFAGDVLEPRKLRAKEALRAVPLDRLLIESDAPAMLPPEPYRRHVLARPDGELLNEPANLAEVLRGIAELRGQDEQVIADGCRQNAIRLFGDLLR